MKKKIRLANCGQTSRKSAPPSLLSDLFVLRPEVVVGPVAAGEADDGAFGREVATPRELKQRRNQLAMGQVSGRAEEHDGAWLGDPRPRQRLTQGVRFGKRVRIGHRDRSRQ